MNDDNTRQMSEAGKGSDMRKSTKESRDNFSKGYDGIKWCLEGVRHTLQGFVPPQSVMHYKYRVTKALVELESTNAGDNFYRSLVNDGWIYNIGVVPASLPKRIDVLDVAGNRHAGVGIKILDWKHGDEYAVAFWRPSTPVSDIPIPEEIVEAVKDMTGVDLGSEPDVMNEGRKDDSGKIRLSLLPKLALKEVMGVLEHGAIKYGEQNWRKLDNLQDRYTDSAFRHLLSDSLGEDMDEDSECYHLACAITGLMFKLEDKLMSKK